MNLGISQKVSEPSGTSSSTSCFCLISIIMYRISMEDRIIPSYEDKVRSEKKISNRIPVPTKSEPSLFKSDLEISIGLINATNPNMIPRLNIFEPSTFPTDIESWPLKAAEIVTANSGAEVAMATIVKPITKSERPNFLAIFEADSTIQEAPPHNPIIDIIKIIILNKIWHQLLFKTWAKIR